MSGAGTDRQLVAFTLHGDQYALPLAAVREIIRYIVPTATGTAAAVPGGLVRGMINLRGEVLPVADLSPKLGRPIEITPRSRILVLELSNGPLGLIVDTVDGVMTVPADRIGPLPVALPEDAVGDEIAAVEDRLVILVDPERALGAVRGRPAPRRRRPAAARTSRAKKTEP